MKKIIETVAEGGGDLGVHMYPYLKSRKASYNIKLVRLTALQASRKRDQK